MAWNEPGGNDNDPWGNKKNSGGPPDLDEVFKNISKKVERLFSKKGGGSSNGGSGSRGQFPTGNLGSKGLGVLVVLALVAWSLTGFYIIEPAQAGVVTRFGAHTTTSGPGLHWRMPWPFEEVERVDVEQVRTVSMDQQITLTQDENLVKITLSVQYNIKNAEDFLFNLSRPDRTLEQVVESAVREAIGQTDMESILTTNVVEPEPGDDAAAVPVIDSQALQTTTLETVQRVLDEYQSGLLVTAVSLEEAQPPDEVQAAFSDAIKAREDKERIISEAEAYSNEILPQARGDAERIKEEAEGYKTRVEQSAIGESKRFLALLTEYEKAPEVTRERLYIEAMESVLGSTSKVLMDSGDGGNSLMYLPIDKLIGQAGSSEDKSQASTNSSGAGNLGTGSVMNSSNNDQPRFNDISKDNGDLLRDAMRSRERGVER